MSQAPTGDARGETRSLGKLTSQAGTLACKQSVPCHIYVAVAARAAATLPKEIAIATGWAGDGAVQDQIDATVKDGINRAKSQLPHGPSLSHCAQCGNEIPEARRSAVPGVRLCLACQEARDREADTFSGYNRRGSKDSQLR